ncbi:MULTISPECIES: DJ-1/PfpI family protein [Nocardioides]|uniref:DJ-1/PfpI family protein n=1 Tax=Nocardioides lianchengensis TaxID=1045774 RepID=A0A1G6K5X8_9ACTN|nr:DJ-1/PfpI family protein [Nocardioides lianchengensis]NYG08893.1 transcriptional regulator GlxA family with amidase domain [Nocardioides lianchengensis]SDC26241.1 DJ-1/PfpI family protein [Nocardioides lianchengensis]
MTTRTVAILAFDDMEVLDYAGPYEVFNVAGELGAGHPFEVFSVGLSTAPAVGRGGFAVLPTYSLEDAPPCDVLVVPGGAGTRPLLADERLLAWLRERAGEVDLLVSVCTGALLLGAAGLLADRPATTHHDAFDELAAISPTTEVVRGERYVRSSDAVLTSAGVSAGIDCALHAVELLADQDTRDRAVTEMEWGWRS